MDEREANSRTLTKLQEFCKINEQFNVTFTKLETESKLTRNQLDEVYISYIGHELLHVPQYLENIVRHFSEELPRLLCIAIFFDGESYKFNWDRHVINTVLLGRILKLRSDFSSFALKYFDLYPSPFEQDSTQNHGKKSRNERRVNLTELDFVESCYSLLLSDVDFYKQKWNWSKFIKTYFIYPCEKVRWITAKCIGILNNMNETQLESMILSLMSEKVHDEFTYVFHTKSTLVQCREMPQIDFQPIVNMSVNDAKQTALISGIHIPTNLHAKPNKITLIEVESTRNNLRKISLGLSLNKAVCLQGVVGCGKTSLVEYLAAKTGRILGNDFIKIQLGDQMDTKTLLGTYRCTDIPGEFVWQPGVLTQAVMEGSWLLMEDVDSANMDIASILSCLMENRSLSIPGFRDNVPISPGFQLFLTRRFISTSSGQQKKVSNPINLMKKHLIQINIDPFTVDELRQIVREKYSEFRFITDKLVDVFRLFDSNVNFLKNSRLISTRDFFKWCSRAVVGFDPKSQASTLKVLQDAIDIFCCSFSQPEDYLNLSKHISSVLGVINQKAEYFCLTYKPTIELTNDSFLVGRASMPRERNEFVKNSKFSFTRPSAVLLERIMCCVNASEPVLLVGETGTGKTSTVQYLASTLGQKLVVINMNQQSDSADLLGGFKPVDLKFLISPLKEEFEQVFADYFKVEPNRKFLSNISYCYNSERWSDLIKLMRKSCEVALERLSKPTKIQERKRSSSEMGKSDLQAQNKKNIMLSRWRSVGEKLKKIKLHLKQKTALAFAFIEGTLVKAIQNGYWVLLDEINLANAETLECLSGLLEGTDGSLCLLERGDKEPLKRHPKFILFACMNPSTDVGKRDLPPGLRNRFTEFFVHELTEKNDLLLLVVSYLESFSFKENELNKIVEFYLKVRKEAETTLIDGIGHKPHYSLRSLCRALSIASKNPCGTFKRSLYESFCLSFLTQLNDESYKTVKDMITKYILGKDKEVKAVLNQPIPKPTGKQLFVEFEGYWVQKGNLESAVPDNYILTESVRKNLRDLVRVVSIGKLPVLLQGDTSVGKTSLITYVAKASGNKCVRINNHEHTDLQEYIGSYVADVEGKLVFREGLLVEAMRQGHWIILDELNLAPTDVLEALNRVLDDNRELFIPETQEVVRAHHNFMLFATQNPPGAYGGRKMLSRAFRNRFVELHFTEIPPKELEIILQQRCEIAPSYAKKMINVMTELQMRRRGSAAFAGKQGFITLRDLFRWGERYRLAKNTDKLYDWDQHLADEGYLVLAGKVRKSEEKEEIISVLMKHLKRLVEPHHLFTLSDKTSTVTRPVLEQIYRNSEKCKSIVWTFSMRQLAVLVAKALQFKEPVLIVGETGGGKTTVCKILAENNGQRLMTVNCHMHTESSDFIGGLRPVRNHEKSDKLFEWVDGLLIQAMQNGDVFLADEISLADDSVLERLNSLLEPERCLLLAEKGADLNNAENSELIEAHDNFYFIGTMNPGGDFGKKELSPALRNRFTEIWCEPCSARNDLIDIVEANVNNGISFGNQEDGSTGIGKRILDFIEWFKRNEVGKKFTISIRDILTWVKFINNCAGSVEISESYVHGACLTFLDSFGSGTTSAENPRNLQKFYDECISFLNNQLVEMGFKEVPLNQNDLELEVIQDKIGINPFFIDFDNQTENLKEFFFNAPTTLSNTRRVLRGMQLNKAILLEGSPGVGKTSLISALADFSGHKIYRINLSDQTDVSDLFGADLPVEGGTGGQFSWKDGPLLQALKQGHWILLDELNLASQSVLEGLNACLDHRGEIFIPELSRTFVVKEGTRFFAAQNPLKQGGSRRGLPQSFLNRFIQVYINLLTSDDLYIILTQQFPQIPKDLIGKMIEFNCTMEMQLNEFKFGNKGAPWECNLRDITRWCEVTIFHSKERQSEVYHPEALVHLLYGDRMRTLADKEKVNEIFENVFKVPVAGTKPILYFNNERVHFGDVSLSKSSENSGRGSDDSSCLVLRKQLQALRSLCYCVNLGWMSILVGSSSCGKSSVVKTLANLAGKTLKTLPVTSAMDTTDILGGFEQTDYTRHLDELTKNTEVILNKTTQDLFLKNETDKAVSLLGLWESLLQLQGSRRIQTITEEIQLFISKLEKLDAVWDFINGLRPMKAVEKLRKRASKLKEHVRNDKSLNAGGKFEWVDSVLIKCLQNGYWLMVDNVNLCSSAVLDRLNALLEPNGVLTIGERGMDKNGKMMEIKPHKDFRLFLTMDPKNGEISRAMRNRGVEIYILNDREGSIKNEYDLKSMIQLNGLKSKNHTNLLLEMHDFFDGLILGEKPNLSELLQAACIISQQLKYGIGLYEAFLSTLLEVYHKTRSPIEFNTNDVREVVSAKLMNSLENSAISENDWFSEYFTIRTDNLKVYSTLEKFKQESALLQSIVNSKITDNKKIEEFLLMMFYTRSTKNDLEKRHNYIEYILKDTDEDLWTLAEKIFSDLSYCENFPTHLPVDYRWLPDTPYSTRNKLNVNQTTLRLFLILLRHNEISISRTAHVSLLDYMRSRKMNKVEDKFNDVIISNFLELLQSFDNNILQFLSELNELEISNEIISKILLLIMWRFNLFKCALVDGKTQFEQSKIITNMRIHYHWFLKYSVNEVVKLTGMNIRGNLRAILKEINTAEDKKTSGVFKIGKNYQKFIDKPTPFTDKDTLETMVEYEKISISYNMSDSRNNFKEICRMMENNSNIRNLLIDFKTNPENVKDKLKVLQITHSKNEDKDLGGMDKYKVELTPLYDYLERLQMRKFISSESEMDDFLKTSRITPTELISSCTRFNASKDPRLVHELMKNYFFYLNHSPCGQLKMFINDDSEESEVNLNEHHPVLTYYLCSLLMNNYELNVTKLGHFRNSMMQHRILNLTLWKNLKKLHSEDYDFICLETKFIENDSRVFIEQLSKSFSCKNLRSSEKLVEYCIDHMKSYKHSLSSLDQRRYLEKCQEILQISFEKVSQLHSDKIDNINDKIHLISTVHTYLGYLKFILNAQMNIIDPLMKKSLKRKYYEDAIQYFERITSCFEFQNAVFSGNTRTIHELYGPIKNIIHELAKKREMLAEYVAVRLEHIEYESVLKSVNHALSSILSLNSFAKIEEADFFIEKILKGTGKNEDFSSETTNLVLSKLESSIASYENLILDWAKYRLSYPDIIEPLLCNVAQFLYGYKMKAALLKKLIRRFEFFERDINLNITLRNIVKFPVLDEHQINYIEHIKNYTNEKTQKLINDVLVSSEVLLMGNEENFKLLKCGIQETFNACITSGDTFDSMNKRIYNEFFTLLKKFVHAYNSQEETNEEQQKEAESLYKTKIKCQERSEEQQVEEEMKELFPNFHVIDFPDLQKNVQLDDEAESCPNEKIACTEIAYDDLKFVAELHMTLLRNFTKSEWLCPEKDKSAVCSYIKPLIEKFKVFRKIMEKTLCSLDFTMDKELFGSFNVLLSYIQSYGKEELLDVSNSPKRILNEQDFYKDSNVDEVKSCFHILEELKTRINQLLDEWPEQPTLKTIMAVIDRIYSFDITSPVSRFLTGLEILLSKCHEWEQVAHSGVSLAQNEQSLIQQIISWRKQELVMWKNLLNSTFSRLNESKTKWWLYLFKITEQFIFDKLFSIEELISTLRNFITSSSIAEFESRLDLLYVFHCHAINFVDDTQDYQTRIYYSILWNIYQYYDQYRPAIVNKVKDLRSPIEKKLKDYVKIVKWKDVSYWSVKETVDKSHKILHKHVREFKDVMKQPVNRYLIHTNASVSKEENVGIWDRPQRHSPTKHHYTLDSSNYIAKKSLKKISQESTDNVSKTDAYFSKSRQFCKEIIESTAYPNYIRDLDEFITEIIETGNHLQKLEVDTTLPKSKQKSQAKNILQQKHRALADLFRTLSKIGLSYRTGIVDNTARKNSEDFIMKPVDLKASFNHVGTSRNDEKILTIWDSCELYFTRSLIRFNSLENALKQPAQDLGLNNIQRCQGYSSHLISLSLEQKDEMIGMSRNIYYLKHYFNNITKFSNMDRFYRIDYLEDLKIVMENTILISNQYKIILNSCPVEDNLELNQVEIMKLFGEEEACIQYKNDPIWNEINDSLEDITKTASKILKTIKKSIGAVPCVEYKLSSPSLIPVEDDELIEKNLSSILSNIGDISNYFKNTHLFDSLKWLNDRISKQLNTLHDKSEDILENTVSEDVLKLNIDKSSTKILYVIQEMYKKYCKISKPIQAPNDEESNGLEDDLMKKILIDQLSLDIQQLDHKKILKSVSKVIATVHQASFLLSDELKLALTQYSSLLDQIILLYQYFLTQQVSSYRVTCKLNSILLNIFIELAAKGFCVPPEFSDEMDGEGNSQPSDGMGLSEGKGEKDISDKIESEDQLDDAQLEGQEKEDNEDPDCEENENGIEMSEDFDSKLQDKKERENDEENENSDSDAEEQMGETAESADKLDEEIWGSDKEEDDQNDGNDDQEDESGNKGEDEQDHQIGAKEKDSKNQPEGDKDDQKGDEKEKNQKEINEMNEPEYDEEQIDPYHGNLPEPPEPEPMEIPEDINLDGAEEKDGEQEEENPFDIDAMKEQNIPEESEGKEEEGENAEKQKDEIDEFSSDDENIDKENREDSMEKQEDENVDGDEKSEEGANEELQEGEPENLDEEDKNEEVEKSGLDQSQTNADNVEAMEIDESETADKTSRNEADNKSSQPIDNLNQEDKPDQDGMGQSQMEESSSGHSTQTSKPQETDTNMQNKNEELKRKEKPGESDNQRSLGDINEPVKKKLKTLDDESAEKDQEENEDNSEAEMYKHIKEAKENATQTLDAATKEQAEAQKEQSVPNEDEEKLDEEPTESSKDLPEEKNIDNIESNESAKQKPEKLQNEKKKEQNSHPDGDIMDEMEKVEIEGELIETSTVPRGEESSHHALLENDKEKINSTLTIEEINSLRNEVEHQMSSWYEPPTDFEAEQAWQKISSVTTSLAQELSEQLRLVLEPTQASRLKGDYRTGRRINMRKVIPYIASQFRKDKIWLRRTKPSKREYQIVLAIDDSSSMTDNKSKEMAFESIALISKALSLLESGQLAVLSFGERTEILHKLTEQFSEKSGVKLLQKFKFDQTKTCLAKLVDFVTEMMDQSQHFSTALNAKLLIIVSDGRGVFSEGETMMKQAVRRGKLANIFTVFVIIDNPANKSSVLDIRMPVFKDGKLLEIKNYMDVFPFSFYILLRDLNTLPYVLSDALRQWFEIISNLDRQ